MYHKLFSLTYLLLDYVIDDVDEFARLEQMEEDERLAKQLEASKVDEHHDDEEIARRIQMEADEKLARE